MATIKKNPILEFPENIIQKLRTAYGVGEPGKIDEVLDNLQDWIKAQNHFLKKDFSKHYLETCLIPCKGSLDRAKSMFEKMCILRTLLPDYFSNGNPKDLAGLENFMGGVLPKQDTNNNRVAVFKDTGSSYTSENFKNFFKLLIYIAEYLKNHDYCDGFVLVCDLLDINFMELISSVNVVDLRHVLTILMDGYGMRLKGIHLVVPPNTATKAIDMVLSIFKGLISEKIADRLHIHKSMDAVFEHVPKDILPAEYGGQEISLKDLYTKWMDVLSSQEHLDFMKVINEAKIDAVPTDALREEHLGTAVNFRKLEVD